MNIHQHGFEVLPNFISNKEIEAIKTEIAKYSEKLPKYGIRNADKKFTSIQTLCSSNKVVEKAESILKK